MERVKTAFILNIVIFVCVLFSIVWMMSGISSGVFSAASLGMFRFYTVDSNIVMGIAALISAFEERAVLKGKKRDVSLFSLVFKLIGTVGVTLTMLVTVFYLAPSAIPTTGFFSLFYYSNFFLHLLNPLLSVIVFCFFEKTYDIPFRHTFTGIVSMIVYAVYYVAAAFIHSSGGVIEEGYDWYGFFFGGISSAVIVLPLITAITYGISFFLWKLNRHNSNPRYSEE